MSNARCCHFHSSLRPPRAHLKGFSGNPLAPAGKNVVNLLLLAANVAAGAMLFLTGSCGVAVWMLGAGAFTGFQPFCYVCRL